MQALLIALAVCLLPGQTPALRLAALALAGACIGFLPFNLPEARLFLGDVGSHALAAAVIGLVAGQRSLPHVVLARGMLMLSSVLLVDALSTLAAPHARAARRCGARTASTSTSGCAPRLCATGASASVYAVLDR